MLKPLSEMLMGKSSFIEYYPTDYLYGGGRIKLLLPD